MKYWWLFQIVEFTHGLGSSGSGSMDIQFGFNIDGNVTSSAQVDYSIDTVDAIFATSQRTPAKTDVSDRIFNKSDAWNVMFW